MKHAGYCGVLFAAMLWHAQAQTTSVDLRTQVRNVDFSALPTKPVQTGTELPAWCSVGQVFFKTDAPAGQNLYGCTSANFWSPQSAPASQAQANYGMPFSGQQVVSIAGAVHGMGTANLVVECYDAGAPARRIEPDAVEVNGSTYDVTISFSVPQSGWCVVNGSGGGASGAVPSVFGRTGAVVAQKGDYSLTMLADVGAVHGNGSTVQMFGGGAASAGDCARFDSRGNIVSTGAPCGTGAGSMQAGPGVAISRSPEQTVLSVDTAVVPMFLTARGSLAFGVVPGQACVQQNLPVLGAAVGDAVAAGWPAALMPGLTGTMRVTSAGVVTIMLCNVSASGISTGNAEYRATIVRSM